MKMPVEISKAIGKMLNEASAVRPNMAPAEYNGKQYMETFRQLQRPLTEEERRVFKKLLNGIHVMASTDLHRLEFELSEERRRRHISLRELFWENVTTMPLEPESPPILFEEVITKAANDG